MPRELGAFGNRLNFPETWAGRSGADLAEASGVPDAIFCHSAGFYCSARSRQGIGALIESAPAG